MSNHLVLQLNYHRRFARGTRPLPHYDKTHLQWALGNNNNKLVEWLKEPYIYQTILIYENDSRYCINNNYHYALKQGLNKEPVFINEEIINLIRNEIFKKSIKIDFSLLNNIKNTDKVSGKIMITQEEDNEYVITCEWTTLPPRIYYKAEKCFSFYNNEELADVIDEITYCFR